MKTKVKSFTNSDQTPDSPNPITKNDHEIFGSKKAQHARKIVFSEAAVKRCHYFRNLAGSLSLRNVFCSL